MIQCEKCGKTVKVSKNDIDFDATDYDDHGEDGMGMEVEYSCKEEVDCPYCGNEIEFSVSGFEYPEGAFNYESSEVDHGGKFVEEPHMVIVD